MTDDDKKEGVYGENIAEGDLTKQKGIREDAAEKADDKAGVDSEAFDEEREKAAAERPATGGMGRNQTPK